MLLQLPIILHQHLQVVQVKLLKIEDIFTYKIFLGSTKPESDGDDDDCILVSDNPSENPESANTTENTPPISSAQTATTSQSLETTTKSVYSMKTNDCVPATTASDDAFNSHRQVKHQQKQTAQNEPTHQQSQIKKSMPNIRNIPAPYPSINYQAQKNEGEFFRIL